jgi:hypothetical protein
MLTALIQLFRKLICSTDVNVFSDCVRLANTENVTINSRGLVSLPQYTLFIFQMSLTNTVILYIYKYCNTHYKYCNTHYKFHVIILRPKHSAIHGSENEQTGSAKQT